MFFSKWLEERTGLCGFCKAVTNWSVPTKNCCCRFIPTALVYLFLFQAITGVFLFAFYSASTTSAWESVFYIQYVLPYGWLIRGIHHFSAQLFVGLLGFYLFALIIHGAYRRPREFVYWSALVMFLLALCSCLTGDLLSWSQSGYFATITRVSFLQLIPFVGPELYQLVVGGPDPQFGVLTLTRFLFLHVCVFGGGALLCVCLWKYFDFRSRKLLLTESRFDDVHVCGLACASKKRRSFWNCDAFFTGLVGILVLCAVLLLVFQHSLSREQIANRAPTLPAEAYLGAELTAPVDIATSYDAARPEWSFRALYHMTKLPIFSKIGMVYAIFVVPPLIVLFFFAVPLLGRFRVAHWFNVCVTVVFFIFVCYFTYLSYMDDYKALWAPETSSLEQADDSSDVDDEFEHSRQYLEGVDDAKRTARRAVELAFAPTGIPKTGALELTKNDPFLQGPILFEQHCASCHNFTAKNDDARSDEYPEIYCSEPTAPNLYGARTSAWIRGFTNEATLADVDCFGNTAFAQKGSMVGFMNGRVLGGQRLEDGSFILNPSGLIGKLIAADTSPAYDVMEAVFEDFCGEESNLEILSQILNEDGSLDEAVQEEACQKYLSALRETLKNKVNDEEDFVTKVASELPRDVWDALKGVLIDLLDDEKYEELLLDEDNVELVKDESYDDFLTDSYLAALNGSDEPIPAEEQSYINRLRESIVSACNSVADILADEAQLSSIRPFVAGEYLGLAPNAITDMEFLTCTECHAFYGKAEKNDHACDLRGYMSRDWIAGFIADPTQTKYYGAKNDRMPSYCPQEGDSLLTETEVGLLADWLSGVWYKAPIVENTTRLGVYGTAKASSALQEEGRLEREAESARVQAEIAEKISKETAEREEAEAAKKREAEVKAKEAAEAKSKREAEEKARLEKELQESKTSLQQSNEEAKTALEQANARTNEALDKASVAEAAAAEASKNAASVSEKLASVEKERDAAKAANDALQSQVVETKTAADKQVDELQSSLQKTASERNELQQQNAQLKSLYEERIKTLNEMVSKAQEEANAARAETEALRIQLQEAAKSVDENAE